MDKKPFKKKILNYQNKNDSNKSNKDNYLSCQISHRMNNANEANNKIEYRNYINHSLNRSIDSRSIYDIKTFDNNLTNLNDLLCNSINNRSFENNQNNNYYYNYNLVNIELKPDNEDKSFVHLNPFSFLGETASSDRNHKKNPFKGNNEFVDSTTKVDAFNKTQVNKFELRKDDFFDDENKCSFDINFKNNNSKNNGTVYKHRYSTTTDNLELRIKEQNNIYRKNIGSDRNMKNYVNNTFLL